MLRQVAPYCTPLPKNLSRPAPAMIYVLPGDLEKRPDDLRGFSARPVAHSQVASLETVSVSVASFCSSMQIASMALDFWNPKPAAAKPKPKAAEGGKAEAKEKK